MNTCVAPFITFCIPHFNNPELLKRCLASLESGAVAFEVIIVDDCSTMENFDQVKSTVAGWSGYPIRLFRNRLNRGVTFTKNRCYWHAGGTWCCFLDCDDYFVAGGLDDLSEYLRQQSLPIQLFHCANEVEAHVKESRIFTIREYASEGTGGEALTVVKKEACKIQPYFSQLRGYEGLGLIRLADLLNCPIVLGNVSPRHYSTASDNRLSVGSGLRKRALKIAFGHIIILTRYGRYLTLRRKIRVGALIVYFTMLYILQRLRYDRGRQARA